MDALRPEVALFSSPGVFDRVLVSPGSLCSVKGMGNIQLHTSPHTHGKVLNRGELGVDEG